MIVALYQQRRSVRAQESGLMAQLELIEAFLAFQGRNVESTGRIEVAAVYHFDWFFLLPPGASRPVHVNHFDGSNFRINFLHREPVVQLVQVEALRLIISSNRN